MSKCTRPLVYVFGDERSTTPGLSQWSEVPWTQVLKTDEDSDEVVGPKGNVVLLIFSASLD